VEKELLRLYKKGVDKSRGFIQRIHFHRLEISARQEATPENYLILVAGHVELQINKSSAIA
jgi:hypothetical protein